MTVLLTFNCLHFLGCQVKPGGDVFVNTVGTFGVASASYYGSRVAGSIGRLLQYLSGHSSTSWHMLVADDYLSESGGSGYRIGLLPFFVLCAVVGVPLSWHKTCGGDTLVWVGFEILLRSHSVGISSKRAEWFLKSAEKVHLLRRFTWHRSKRTQDVLCLLPERSNVNVRS